MASSRPSRSPSADRQGIPATALWFPRARTVELRREVLPAPGPGEVRVRALASGLSHGTEMLVYRGEVPAGTGLDLSTLRGSFAFPISYGYASVGRVVSAAEDVDAPRPGDLVFVHHPHQTGYVVPASLPVILPADLPPELGVFLANVETAINVMLDAHPRLGERVVIFGQGVVGLLLTQLARRTGVERIVTVDPIPLRRELSLRVGADVSLAPGDSVAAKLRDLTGGVGADLAVEASGNPAALAAALNCVAAEGTVVVSSWYGTKEVTLPLGEAFHRGRIRLVSSQVGSIDPALTARWNHRRRLDLARDLLPTLLLAPLITHRVPFVDAAEAYALVDRHHGESVQVVLSYGGEDV